VSVLRPSSALSYTLQVSTMLRRVGDCVRRQGKADGHSSIRYSYAFWQLANNFYILHCALLRIAYKIYLFIFV
jgi:hypothetical protein